MVSTLAFVVCLALVGCDRESGPDGSARASFGGATEKGRVDAPSPIPPAASAGGVAPAGAGEPEAESSADDLRTALEKHRAAGSMLREAVTLTQRGEFAVAHRKLDASLALRPRQPGAWAARAALLRAEGKYDESLAFIAGIIAEEERAGRLLDADRSLLLREEATTQLAKGDLDRALATVEALIVDDAPRLRDRYLRARILATRGDLDATISALEDAIAHGFLGASQLRADEAFASLSGDERFVAMVDRLDSSLAESRRRTQEFLAAEARGAVTGEPESDADRPESTNAKHTETCLLFLERNLERGIGKPRELSTEALVGRSEFHLSSFRGQPTIVQFWGMWSEASREQVERLVAATAEHRQKGLAVVLFEYAAPGAPSGVPEADAVRWLESKAIDVPCGTVDKERWKAFGVPVFPATYFLDAEGRSALHLFGPIEEPLLRKIADRLLATMARTRD